MAEKKSTPKKLNASNTKTEMLDAYNTLMKEIEETGKAEPKPEEKITAKEVEKHIVKADKLNGENIIKDIAELKFKFGKALTELSEKLEEESSKYESLKKAIEAKEKELIDIFEIRKEAASLTALIEAQVQKKSEFEEEMTEEKEALESEISSMKEAWDKEKISHQNEIKERDAQEKKFRDRQKEEFDYNFKLEQKQFADKFNAEKNKLERELAKMKEDAENSLSEREKSIKEKEDELAMLRQKAAGYQKEMDSAIAKAVKEATERIIMENKFKESLSQKEFEGERNVFQAMIKSLETKLKEQSDTIQNLNRQIDKSYQQVQDIAVKAVEGSKVKQFAHSTEQQ
ncbi:MAG: hypothetical protein QG635_393 [Bacteroidota bacterium]|nr:hypothetical protein [Bacteroidota bacterium]